MENSIEVKNLSKQYSGETVLDNISFNVFPGEIIAIFGPNGCGKSTLLNIISGRYDKSSGKIKLTNFNSKKFSYIFQNYRESLLPWKDNYENLAFPLQLNNLSESKIKDKINELESLFSFSSNFSRYPYQLSGGQQQVLAFMRALITEPNFLFIDEPFSALDYENNLLLREHLQNYYLKYKPTILIITHNIEEAVHLADKIIVLSKKPSRIVEIINNKEKYPRNLDFLSSKQFIKIKKQILDAFERGVSNE